MNTIDKLKIVFDILQDAEISGINDINHFKGAKKHIEDVIIEINNKCKTCKSLQIKKNKNDFKIIYRKLNFKIVMKEQILKSYMNAIKAALVILRGLKQDKLEYTEKYKRYSRILQKARLHYNYIRLHCS